MKQIIYTIRRNTYWASGFFWQDDAKIAYVPGVSRQVAGMAVNDSGIQNTSRALWINKNTVICALWRGSFQSYQYPPLKLTHGIR
jgi:hypothetical protein